MTRHDIIRMAVEAGFLTNELGSYLISPYTFEDQDLFDEFERFAELVAAAEREACARAAEDVVPRHTECGNKIAAAIQTRGKK